MSKIKFDAEDVLKLFSKMEKRINDLECFIQKCCDKIPINVGNGAGLFKKYFNGHWQFKSILAGTNVTVTEQDNTITINATSESITCEDINDCLGISEAGQANKFLNEQGDFVTVSGSGFTCNDLSICSTTNLPEGINLYFTNGRAISALTGQNISLFNNNAGYITEVTESPNRVAYFDNNGDLKTNSNFVYNETSNIFNAALPIPGGFCQLSSGASKIGVGDVSSPDAYIQVTPSGIGWSIPSLSADTFILPYNDGNSGDVLTTDGNGSLTFQPIPTGFSCSDLIGCNISNLTNDSGYITSSALSPYLTSASAALTYQPLLGFTPEDVTNKTDVMSGNTTSSTKYLSAKGVYDWVIALGYQVALTAANFGAFINGLTDKTTPVDADAVSLMDSADSNNSKKLTWANIKATLKTYFDTLYSSPIYSPTAGNTIAEIIDDFAYVTPLIASTSSSYAMIHTGSNVISITNLVSSLGNQIGVVLCQYNGSGDNVWSMIRVVALGQGEVCLGCYMRRPNDSGAANQSNLRFGLRLGAGDGTDGVFFKLNEATNSDRWQCITRASSVSTTSNTSVTTAKSSWVRLFIVINAAGTEAKFYIDGTLVATHNTNMPAAGTALSGILNLERTVISSTITWLIDYFYIKQTFTTPR